MNKIEKLLRKVNPQNRQRLLNIIQKLVNNQLTDVDIKKIVNSDFYRVRSGRFRIIFHKDQLTKEAVIDSVQLRREDTYKNF